MLGLSVWLATGPAVWAPTLAVSTAVTAAAAGRAGTGPLTCFAADVSGSNLVTSGVEPASDPGPVFVRQQVVQLFVQVLADVGEGNGQQIGVVTFGTGLGTRIGPLPVSPAATRTELESALPGALRPPAAQAAWTNWVAGISGCAQMFARAGDPRGMVVVLTDGFPQGPVGGPAAQLAAIAPVAARLWSHDITIQPVLYGGSAGSGPARQAMTRLAALGHGQLVLAATPLAMLRAALSLASLSTGVPLGGSEVAVDGSTTIPLDVSPQVAAAVLVVLRSSGQLRISIGAPAGRTLANSAVGTPGLGLVVALTRPMAATYRASADGQGSMYAAELLRYAPVTAPASGRSPSRPRPTGSRTGTGSSYQSGAAWLAGAVIAAVTVVLAGLYTWLVAARRRRPRGTLVVWWGSRFCLLDPADVVGLTRLEELFRTADDSTGWSVSWTRRAPVAFGPEGSALRLMPEQTRTVATTPSATLTWFPEGLDGSLAEEPPGRPASASAP
jgi:hypothetical protein